MRVDTVGAVYVRYPVCGDTPLRATASGPRRERIGQVGRKCSALVTGELCADAQQPYRPAFGEPFEGGQGGLLDRMDFGRRVR